MTTYIDLLPDEICLKVHKYLYDQVMWDIEGGKGMGVGLELYYLFCPENSDYVRSEYLKRTYMSKKILDDPMSRVENDWWKYLVDLERPTVYCSPLCNWKHYYVRRWEVMSDGMLKGGLYWNSAFDSAQLTREGWFRLTNHLSDD